MKQVTVMSGPAIRKLKADNSRLREQNRRLRTALVRAERFVELCLSMDDETWERTRNEARLALAAARELL